MNYKSIIRLSLILALAAVPMTGLAQEADQPTGADLGQPGPWIFTFWGTEYAAPNLVAASGNVETKVEVGYYDASVGDSDSSDMAAEYLDTENGPTVNATVASHGDAGSFQFLAAYQSKETNAAALDFDVKRTWRSKTGYQKFLRRLGHDPMTNLEATSFNGKVVFHTDLDPDQDYEFNYSVIDSRNEFQFKGLEALTIGLDVREQWRKGHAQAYTTSHCDTCHIYSQSHELDENTSDATVSAKVGWKSGYAKASYTARSLTHGTSSVPITFDDALHPELRKPVFDNRLQWDSAEGEMRADLWPDIDKNKTRIDLVFNNVGGFTITGNGVWSQTENKYTNLKADYKGYILTAAKGWKSGWRFRWRGRAYTLDNDDIFVDVNDRVSIAGPHVGQTYEDVYSRNFDHVRMSAMNRDAFESRADVSYRFGRKAGTVRFIWNYDTIDRENYDVLPGEFKTTKNLLGASYRARPAKGWNFEANLKYAKVDNAFMIIDGRCSTLVSDRYTNPWNPETPQYTDFHEARIGEGTASASSWGRADLRLGYTSGNTTIFGKYIYFDGDNNDGDLNDWQRQSNTALVTVWSAPTENWNLYATYSWMKSDLDVPVCIPVFDG